MNPEALWVEVYNYRDASGERVYSSADVAFFISRLQCFDAVGWAAGRASGL